MKSTHVEKKIIWAIDPFEESLKSKAQLTETLRKISKNEKVGVEPVYVLNFSLEEYKNFKMAKHQHEQHKHAAVRAIVGITKEIRRVPFLTPKILMVEDSSPLEAVRVLIDYATSTHARLIVVGTHARQGLPRLFLGSFTEMLLLYSQIPVVTVGPECLAHSSQGRILFATDLSEKSTDTFHRVLQFAQALKLSIVVYHVVSHGIEPIIQSGTYLLGGGWVSNPDGLNDDESQKQKLVEEWVKEGKERGVSVEATFDFSQGNIADLILNYAKRESLSWLAMVAESGLVKSAVVGSIVRRVVRRASCPVWIVRVLKDREAKPVQDYELRSNAVY